MYLRGARIPEGVATVATIRCDWWSTISYVPGQKEAIFLILDLAVCRSGEVSSQIAVLTSLLKISYRVVSIVCFTTTAETGRLGP
jgi:hypothetical protein